MRNCCNRLSCATAIFVLQGCVGTGGRCAVWIQMPITSYPMDGIMHELGHNFNLQVGLESSFSYYNSGCQ